MFHFPTPPMPRRNRPKTPMSLYSFWLLPEPSSQLPLPLLLLALPGDAAPQSWLTDAVLRRLQTQNEFSRTEDENEQI